MSLLHDKSVLNLVDFVSLSLLAYWQSQIHTNNIDDLRNIIKRSVQDDCVRNKLIDVLEKYHQEITVFAEKYSLKELIAVIVNNFSWYAKSDGKRNGFIITPQPFIYLARELIQIDKGNTVLDYCSGTAEFILNTYLYTEVSKLYGTEISEEIVIVSKIRGLFLGDVLSISQGNSVKTKVKADKVFADPPFGMSNDTRVEKWFPQDKNIIIAYENIPKNRRMDWTFVLSALDKQKTGGRTVILTNDGLLLFCVTC